MNILGIMVGTNSTAALLQDGIITACASEERFCRRKNTGIYPVSAVEYCLGEGSIVPEDIDYVVFDSQTFNYHHWVVDRDSTFSVFDWLKEQNKFWWPKFYEKREIDYLEVFKDKIIPEHYTPEIIANYIKRGEDIRPHLVKNHLGVEFNKIKKSIHYESHHYYGYYASPFRDERVLSFVMEGWGDDANAVVAMFERGKYTELYKTDICNIGRLYRYMTLLLGMKPNEHEYKVMGLAAYNSNFDYVLNILKETLYLEETVFKYKIRPKDHYFWFREKFKGVRFDVIAAGIQKYVELIFCEWVKNWIKKTGVHSIVISGGVAMNIKAMMEVAKMDEVHNMFVPGNGSDESTAIGACYRAYLKQNLKNKNWPETIPVLENLYLGPSYSKEQIRKSINQLSNNNIQVVEDVSKKMIADILSKGHPVALFSGRMEFGARALGNRSILADPRDLRIIRKINKQIKSRDFWMPFAPVVLEERAADYFINPKNIKSPYMTIGFETTNLANKDIIASLHQGDLTARPQIIEKKMNPSFYDLIKEFETRTSVGGLINTSFNLHGNPIVNSPEDAFYVFFNSGLNYLVLDNFLILKKND